MAIDITMPQLSDTMSEGRILTWHKKEGDTVKRGEALAEVATDKADLEIESFHEGTLMAIHAKAGETVKVGSVIAIVGDPSKDSVKPQVAAPVAAPVIQVASVAAPVAPAVQVSAPKVAPASVVVPAGIDTRTENGERVKISPLARNVAQSYGVDYSGLKGSGEGGRIVKKDIESAAQGAGSTHAPSDVHGAASTTAPVLKAPPSVSKPASAGTEVLSRMRQTIAQRMVESKTSIPHFYMTAKVHADALVRLRESLKPLEQYSGVTYNHLVIRAVALALKAVPRVNASYQGEMLSQPADRNIGIVTAVSDGLLIPVVKRADELSLSDIVSEAKGLVQRARAGKPKADDLVGGTFSVSNMGLFPVEEFSAIISPGQGGILAISSILEEPIVVDRRIEVGSVFRATLSVDHRIIDGVVAAEFLTEFKRLIEDPVLLLA